MTAQNREDSAPAGMAREGTEPREPPPGWAAQRWANMLLIWSLSTLEAPCGKEADPARAGLGRGACGPVTWGGQGPEVHGRQSVLPLRLRREGIPQLLPLGRVTCRLRARGCFGWSLSSWREASHCTGVLGVTPPHWIQVSHSVSAQVCGGLPEGDL